MDTTLAMNNYVQVFLPMYLEEKAGKDFVQVLGRMVGEHIFGMKVMPHPLTEQYGPEYAIISKAALDAYNSGECTFSQLSEDHVIGRQYAGEYLIKNGKFHPRARCIAYVLSRENFAHASSPDPEHAVAVMGPIMYIVKRPSPGRKPKGFVLRPIVSVETSAVYSLFCQLGSYIPDTKDAAEDARALQA